MSEAILHERGFMYDSYYNSPTGSRLWRKAVADYDIMVITDVSRTIEFKAFIFLPNLDIVTLSIKEPGINVVEFERLVKTVAKLRYE